MKKLLSILLCAALVFSLCACETMEAIKDVPLPTRAPESTSEPTQAPVETPEVPAEPETPDEPEGAEDPAAQELSNRVIVSLAKTEMQEYDPENGSRLILSFSYETPTVHIDGRDSAASIINAYLAILDETYYTGNDYGAGTSLGFNMMLEQAEDNFNYVMSTGENMALEFAASRSISVRRADSAVLSLVYDEYVYTGGAHGDYVDRGYVFDTETGDRLRLETLGEDPLALSNALVEYMIGLTEHDPDQYAAIDETMVSKEKYGEVFGSLLRGGSWYLDGDGMVIFSDLYEISTYADGMIVFRIPYSVLKGLIYDKYIPAQRQGEGSFSVVPMDAVRDGTEEIIDRVTVGSGGEELCLKAEGTVYDVKLSQVDYTDAFFETAQLWYASHMSGCSLQISAAIPEGMPELMISYSTADGASHRLLLSQGEDGGIALVDDNIEAIG